MNTTYVIITLLIANLAVSIYYGSALVNALAARDEPDAPTVQAKGAGGGGQCHLRSASCQDGPAGADNCGRWCHGRHVHAAAEGLGMSAIALSTT